MITISLSDRMAQKLWRKLQPKQNEVWVYLRTKLFNSTGFPQIVERITGRSFTTANKKRPVGIIFTAGNFEGRLRHCWRVLTKGTFGLSIDLLDEALNLAEAGMKGGKSEQTKKA